MARGGRGELEIEGKEMKTSDQIRLLGLALLALVATSAATATGAQAGTFTAGAYPATIHGKTSHQFAFALGLMECTVSYHGELAAASEEVTVTPSYESCKHFGGSVDVAVNGCDTRLHAGKEIEAGFIGTMDIVCPEGKAIDFNLTARPGCHLTIPSQEGLIGPVLTNFPTQVDFDFNGGEATWMEPNYVLDSGCTAPGEYEGLRITGGIPLKAEHEGTETTIKVE